MCPVRCVTYVSGRSKHLVHFPILDRHVRNSLKKSKGEVRGQVEFMVLGRGLVQRLVSSVGTLGTFRLILM